MVRGVSVSGRIPGLVYHWSASVLLLVVGIIGIVAAVTVPLHSAWAQSVAAKVEAVEGKLADGAPYLVRKPSNWNGIVIVDLDGLAQRDLPSYKLLIKAGYGTAGADRLKQDRVWTRNRLDDVRRPQEALEAFKVKFGAPRLAIIFGHSAGGAVALMTAERHPDTIDGAVALCATMPVEYTHYNLIFDFFYTLKTLLAPHDERLVTHALPPTNHQHILDHWLRVLQSAGQTPEGRAKIALAYTIAQYPVFGMEGYGFGVPKPDLNDPMAVAVAMIESLPEIVTRLRHLYVSGEKDFPPDLKYPGTPRPQAVGNDGAVYADYWKHSDPLYKRVAEALYASAGVDLEADIKALDAAPRVKPEQPDQPDLSDLPGEKGLRGQGQGLLTMPVFRMDNLGDQTAPPNVSKVYDTLVARNGLNDLYRTAYVDNSGHCYFRPEQELAAVEVMRERLETGKWPATDTASLNARTGVEAGDERIFVDREFGPYTGIWRLSKYTDLLETPSFAQAAALVNSYDIGSISHSRRKQLLEHLTAAEEMGKLKNAGQTGRALDRFIGVAKGIGDAIVRTRLLAVAHQLRSASK